MKRRKEVNISKNLDLNMREHNSLPIKGRISKVGGHGMAKGRKIKDR